MRNGLKIVNSLLFISLLVQAITGLWLFWSGSETIANIHKYNGLIFLALVATHITLNWNWIKTVLLKIKS
jgi:hypothetical protein